MNSHVSVLLVEDSHFFRHAASQLLRSCGFQVFVAVNGEEALRIAANEHLDIALLDLVLPKIQGFEFLQWLRQRPQTSSMPVIILADGSHVKTSFGPYGPVDFLPKNSRTLEHLAQCVQENLNRAA
jgi:CheY-like chemotaxis protein